MTCAALRHGTTATASAVGDAFRSVARVVFRGVVGPVRRLGRRAERLFRRIVDGESAPAQFSRFVFVGGVSSALYAVLFVGLTGLGSQVANLAGSIGSTLLANEMHRRTTFHAGGRVTWLTAQLEGGGLAVVGLVATSLGLTAFHQVAGPTSAVVQLLLIAVVTGLIGAVRFLALRTWVFTHDDVPDDVGPVPLDSEQPVQLPAVAGSPLT